MKSLFPFLLLLLACSGRQEKDKPVASRESVSLHNEIKEEKIVSITVHPGRDSIHLFWKDGSGQNIKTLARLKEMMEAEDKELTFAMNGGMYMEDLSPLGLYIEKGKTLRKKNTRTKGYGNFYIQPGGIFYLTTDQRAGISLTSTFSPKNVRYATQSGPMLLVKGQINSGFSEHSMNRNIRNGVGILKSGEVVMAISSEPVTFYEFASFFKNAGCTDALYLDGGISGAFYPAKEVSPGYEPGYGVLIGVVKGKAP